MTRTDTPWGVWEPASPQQVATELRGLTAPWWIAGGWAIELAVGRPLREHSDTDVLILRRDHFAVQDHLSGRWELWAADPPGTLRPWHRGEPLPPTVHDVWCREDAGSPWRFQLMVDESDGQEWISRRHTGVRRPLHELGRRTAEGIPFLAPEIQLFYKSMGRRPRDEFDFENALPFLDAEARRWLDQVLALTDPHNPWRTRLAC